LIDYFVLWDEILVRELSRRTSKSKARALLHKLELLAREVQHSANKGTRFSLNTDSDWLSKVQDLML
jgi:CTP:molybdopterin cytidylyltransferase MocA